MSWKTARRSFYYETAEPPEDIHLDPATTALLVIDIQNTYLEPKDTPDETARWRHFYERMRQTVIPNTARLIADARRRGVEVIFARIACQTLDGRDRSLSQKKPGFNYLLLPKDLEDSQIVPELTPLGDEITVLKTTDSALTGTNLRLTLANLGIRDVICRRHLHRPVRLLHRPQPRRRELRRHRRRGVLRRRHHGAARARARSPQHDLLPRREPRRTRRLLRAEAACTAIGSSSSDRSSSLPVLFGISVITFVLVRLIPGDPARVLLGTRATPTAIANIRAQYGLDEPMVTQYFYFIANLFKGEMGRSILYKIDVLKLIATRIEPTLALVLASVVLSILIAVPMATIAARNQGRAPDHVVRIVSTLGIGFPPFWLALMLIILFSVRLGVFPVSGYGETVGDKLAHLALPALTVALSLSAVLTRSLRAAMIQALGSDVATAARARGMPEGIVFWRHVVPNSLVPTINLLAVNIGWLIGGTVVVESVFAIPGMGQLLVRAIFSRDYMVVQGVAMVFACATVLVNFLADILTVAADPRVKL